MDIQKNNKRRAYNARQFLKMALRTPKWVDTQAMFNFHLKCPAGY